jgi:hypothetical protein
MTLSSHHHIASNINDAHEIGCLMNLAKKLANQRIDILMLRLASEPVDDARLRDLSFALSYMTGDIAAWAKVEANKFAEVVK